VSFEDDIKPLFRDSDRQAMMREFDLWEYQDVRNNAEAIQTAVTTGDMPCDGPWPDSQVALFQRWVSDGMAP
jgi:hypothetical protein